MMLHSIGRSEGPDATNPWIAKYIFPGGYIPALSEVLPAIERSGLLVCDIEILRLHYAETLKAWRERFMARREEAVRLYDERFARMWEFYLAASEMAFRKQNADELPDSAHQAPGRRADDAGLYLPRAEAKLRGIETAAGNRGCRWRANERRKYQLRGCSAYGSRKRADRLRQLRAQAPQDRGLDRAATRTSGRAASSMASISSDSQPVPSSALPCLSSR